MAIAVLEESEIQKIISEAVKLATAELRDELERSRTPELMNKERLSQYLEPCHVSSINRFMKAGMPYEMCGSEPRFRKCCIDAWLKKRACERCPYLKDTNEGELSRDPRTTTKELGIAGSA